MFDLPSDISAPVLVDHACVARAAAYYAVPPELLIAIRIQEGGTLGRTSQNKNGSHDVGPFQINTIHRTMFAGFGITMEQIRDHECTNTFAGAYIFHRELVRARGDVWRAVGNYHSATPRFHNIYRSHVARRYNALLQRYPKYLGWLRRAAEHERATMLEAAYNTQVTAVTFEGLP